MELASPTACLRPVKTPIIIADQPNQLSALDILILGLMGGGSLAITLSPDDERRL